MSLVKYLYFTCDTLWSGTNLLDVTSAANVDLTLPEASRPLSLQLDPSRPSRRKGCWVTSCTGAWTLPVLAIGATMKIKRREEDGKCEVWAKAVWSNGFLKPSLNLKDTLIWYSRYLFFWLPRLSFQQPCLHYHLASLSTDTGKEQRWCSLTVSALHRCEL